MYNLIIIREPHYSGDESVEGEVLVYQSYEYSGIETELMVYLREHLYLYRTEPHKQYGDIMFIVTHNGTVIEHVNMTNNMDFHNYTQPTKPISNKFIDVYNELRKNVSKNDAFCTNIRIEESKTKRNLIKKYEEERKKDQEIKRLHELMKKYPDEVKSGT
ncbi:hypothetical protein N0S44_000025 [Escherichia coli]|uniref:hypothetical protein n=1 Tax=Escherichia coli TaxID=562 RepID=UPI0022080417|nr:hypothetical protein [Escherichia coli]EJR1978875.1 hypothetical protein [Escherichia coli]UTS53837.1 hypothetical protein UES1_470 [Escherichia phage UE-S1]